MNNLFKSRSILILILINLLGISSCSTMYYKTWETLGKEKRDLLKDNVEGVRDDNIEAKEEFKDALTRLKEMGRFDGGNLEKAYHNLKDDYESCQDRAEDVHDRIDKVESIAEDLFEEWEKEILLISSTRMKKDSAKKLKLTKQKYKALRKVMISSEKRMDSVLLRFRDNVLYLKHNLNAQAIGGLKAEIHSIEKDVNNLIKGMQASIGKADEFIANLSQ